MFSDPFMGRVLLAAVTGSVTVGAILVLVFPPTPRLAPKVRPYLPKQRRLLNTAPFEKQKSDSVLVGLFGPLVESVGGYLAKLLGTGDEDVLLKRLKDARLYSDVPLDKRAQVYRNRQVAYTAAYPVAGFVAATIFGFSAPVKAAAVLFGIYVGSSRMKSTVDAAIKARAARMRAEVYVVNMIGVAEIRSGGSVHSMLRRMTLRGEGPLFDDITELLSWHNAGMSLPAALHKAAGSTPEPHAARLFKLLATGSKFGSRDLIVSLRRNAERVRQDRDAEVQKIAADKTSAMILPVMFILVPIFIMFLGAPMPSMMSGMLN